MLLSLCYIIDATHTFVQAYFVCLRRECYHFVKEKTVKYVTNLPYRNRVFYKITTIPLIFFDNLLLLSILIKVRIFFV